MKKLSTESTNHSIFLNETGRQEVTVTNGTIGNIYEDDAQVDVLDFNEKKNG